MSDITLSDLRVLSPHEPNRHATLSVDTRKATFADLVAALRDHEGVISVPRALQGMSKNMRDELEFTIWMNDPEHNLLDQMDDNVEYQILVIPLDSREET